MNVQIKRIGVSCLLLLLLGIGQSMAQLSISATNTEIKNILRQIEEKSDYTFFYSDNFLDLNQKATIQTKDETIENILNRLFRNTNIDYRINNTQIALSEKRAKENPVNTAQQQRGKTISGTIRDNAGEPVIGATIVEKGNPSHGTVTDTDGNFTLPNTPENATLQITYVGMKPQEVAIRGRTTINVSMEPDVELLEELVVIGYGTMKKKLVTGATVQVKGENIARLNTPNVLGALQSQAPGVNITQVSGFIGDGFKVNIRGIGTNNYSTPLYVIDGVVGGSLDGLSPNDIESIDVLKDAATAAIYGSRAANGVILVKTKSGQAGKHEITYDGYYGIQNLYKIPTVLNAQEFMSIQNEARTMDGLPIYNWNNLIPAGDLASIRDGSWKGTNWTKEILNKNALIQSHSIGINSGTERSVSSLGFTFLQQEATMGVPSDVPILNRFNARLNTEST
ncbi:MAG: TonB-dependent receptor plug domain-containing protein, partial [Petrimonas sp.]|nr:TonB-dependent receptor plug domain-containing protein [Petrimonas sp.]